MSQGLGNEFWEEERQNTLKRTLVSQRGVSAFLVGKLLSAMILVGLVSCFALLAGYAYLSLDFATWPLALLWTCLSGVVLVAGMTTLQLFAWSQRAANVIAMALIFPLMMLGGSFFPFEAMPAWMRAIGMRTPNGWLLARLKDILLGESSPAALLPAILLLLAAVVLLSLVNAWRLRARFARG
jgi:ABC-type multidrug transport system permease subunit